MSYTHKDPHRQSLLALEQELAQRVAEKQQIEQRITNLKQAIVAVMPLVQEKEPGPDLNLPQHCLRVLTSTTESMNVPEIRDALALKGVILTYKNNLAVLHTIIGRLIEIGYVVELPRSKSSSRPRFKATDSGRFSASVA
jgi:hypothetical protein